MREERLDAFFAQLNQLSKGDRTALKREAGVMLPQADGRSMPVFYRCLPSGVPFWQEERYFAAACLHCLWGEEETLRIPLEKIFFAMNQDQSVSASLEHRMESLLDLPWDEDGFLLTKLTRLIKLAKSKGYAVDCACLLEDLLSWNGDRQTVQRKWARALYTKPEDTINHQEGDN